MTTWLIRKTGVDTNGGTSPTVQATGTDGVTNAVTSTLVAASAPFTIGTERSLVKVSSGLRPQRVQRRSPSPFRVPQ